MLFSYGFRPFFLVAALCAVFALGALLAGLFFGAWPPGTLTLTRWHGHEMLFGFVGAAIAGFLLTAAPTWTGSRPVAGAPLAVLTALWLAGRIVMSPWFHLQDSPWILVDATFFPALGVAVGASLVRRRNYRNFVFLFLLAVLTAADCLFVALHLGWLDRLPFDPLRLAADVPVAMIAVVGGRIVPAFTRNALLRAGLPCEIVPSPWLDRAALLAVAVMVGLDVLCQDTPLAGGASAAAAALLGFRLWRWQGHRTLRMPIVWILHAGYGWLVVGLALKALWLVGHVTMGLNWLHALTAGAFGTMILGVMTRVALGHTGRQLEVPGSITLAYVLVIVGAMLRVLASAAMPNLYPVTLVVAGVLWSGAFVIFAVVYLPILLGPRVDAQSV